MPSDDGDVRARILALLQHRRAHLRTPTIDEYGVVRAEGKMVFLSPREQRLAEALLERFGAVVEETDIRQKVFDTDDCARKGAFRICVSRLRKHLAPLGLTISCVRATGYLLHHTEETRTSTPSPLEKGIDETSPKSSPPNHSVRSESG
jgi:DNA-binding response OmpR family regulator